jgi:hypothetical protein
MKVDIEKSGIDLERIFFAPFIPNDLFNYHLQFLVKKDLLVKVKDGYALSEKGLKHVADPYPKNDAIASLCTKYAILAFEESFAGSEYITEFISQSEFARAIVGIPIFLASVIAMCSRFESTTKTAPGGNVWRRGVEAARQIYE